MSTSRTKKGRLASSGAGRPERSADVQDWGALFMKSWGSVSAGSCRKATPVMTADHPQIAGSFCSGRAASVENGESLPQALVLMLWSVWVVAAFLPLGQIPRPLNLCSNCCCPSVSYFFALHHLSEVEGPELRSQDVRGVPRRSEREGSTLSCVWGRAPNQGLRLAPASLPSDDRSSRGLQPPGLQFTQKRPGILLECSLRSVRPRC